MEKPIIKTIEKFESRHGLQGRTLRAPKVRPLLGKTGFTLTPINIGVRVQSKRGFTLVELLVVISIISMLSSTVLASLNDARAKARDAARIQTIVEYKKAFALAYDANGGAYPNTGGATVCIGEDPNDADANCGYSNEFTTQNAAVNNEMDNFLTTLPVVAETTYIAFGISFMSEGVTYKCNNPNCTSAEIYWALEKDSSCPGGEKYSTWNIMCRYTLD